MLIHSINDEYIEIIAIDKAEDKQFQLMKKCNSYIDCNNPNETVIYRDSYAQLNNKLTIENFDELKNARHTCDKLSERKLTELNNRYITYHNENVLSDTRMVHMTKNDILEMNRQLLPS